MSEEWTTAKLWKTLDTNFELLRAETARRLGWKEVEVNDITHVVTGIPPHWGDGKTAEVVPNYPLFIAMAWEIAEFVEQQGDTLMIRFDPERDDKRWTVMIGDERVDCNHVPYGLCMAFCSIDYAKLE